MDFTTIIIAVISLLATGIVIKIIVSIKSNRNITKVRQTNIKANGDVAGRDINKK